MGEKFPFYNNLKPINSRPAVVEHSPVTYIRIQLTTSQPRGQMLESSLEFDFGGALVVYSIKHERDIDQHG